MSAPSPVTGSICVEGDLQTIKHPSVGSVDMGNHATQRQTGQNSMSRTDAVWA